MRAGVHLAPVYSGLKLIGGSERTDDFPQKIPDLDVEGGMLIKKNSILAGGVIVENGLTVGGGATVSGGMNVNGKTTIQGKLTVTGAIDPPVLLLDEQLSSPIFVGNVFGSVWVNGTETPNHLIYTDDTNTDNTVMFSNGRVPMDGPLKIEDTTESGNSMTGALCVDGGVGVLGNINCDGLLGTGVGLFVTGEQVVGVQGSPIADVSVLSTESVTDTTGGASSTNIIAVSGDLAQVTSDTNDNFASTATQLNNINDDLGNLRSQFNTLLDVLRTHGLIAL